MHRVLVCAVQAFVLTIWAAVQPWRCWPQLSGENSHRLTLITCSVLMGILGLHARSRAALPARWVGTVLALVGMMFWHHRHLLQDGAYFEHFLETAWFADGLILVLALTWGIWALAQLPRTWFRRLRWVGAGLVLANLVTALPQAHAQQWRWDEMACAGIMGVDRFLGATGVLWFSILAAWSSWLGMASAALVLLSGKLIAWIGLAVAWLIWRAPPKGWQRVGLVVGMGLLAWGLTTGSRSQQLDQRLLTWWHTAQASLQHPWTGWGFSPMSEQSIATYGYALPSIHADWLSFAYHAGWPMAILVGWVVFSSLRSCPRSEEGHAVRASLVGILTMSLGQSLLGHARVLGPLVLLWVWWRQENEEGIRANA